MAGIVKMGALMLFLAFCGCSDSQGTKDLLRSQGYTDIVTTGYDWFSCGEDDTYATGFRAKSSNGSNVRGVVCSGLLFKGSTIRFK